MSEAFPTDGKPVGALSETELEEARLEQACELLRYWLVEREVVAEPTEPDIETGTLDL